MIEGLSNLGNGQEVQGWTGGKIEWTSGDLSKDSLEMIQMMLILTCPCKSLD